MCARLDLERPRRPHRCRGRNRTKHPRDHHALPLREGSGSKAEAPMPHNVARDASWGGDQASGRGLESYVNELRPKVPAIGSAEEPTPTSLPSLQVSAAERLVQALVAAGVETFFGVPGGPISPVCDAI